MATEAHPLFREVAERVGYPGHAKTIENAVGKALTSLDLYAALDGESSPPPVTAYAAIAADDFVQSLFRERAEYLRFLAATFDAPSVRGLVLTHASGAALNQLAQFQPPGEGNNARDVLRDLLFPDGKEELDNDEPD